MAELRLTIGGKSVALAVQRQGEGAELVYFHDELGSAWNPMLDLLARQFDVISIELPGFGSSQRPDWVESIDDTAYLLGDAVASLGSADEGGRLLVGSSLGGWLALEAVIRRPRLAADLVVIGSPGLEVPGDPPADYFFLTADERKRLFFDDPARAPELDDDTRIHNEIMTGRLVWQPRYVSLRLPQRIHRVAARTLVIWGADDRFLSLAHGQGLAAALPDARLVTVEGSGHFPVYDKPDETAALIAGFVQRR